MRARRSLAIVFAVAACLSAGALALALLLLIDALDTGEAVLGGRSVASGEAPRLFWTYVAVLAIGGVAATGALAAALLAMATDPNLRRRPLRPRRPRPPRSP